MEKDEKSIATVPTLPFGVFVAEERCDVIWTLTIYNDDFEA